MKFSLPPKGDMAFGKNELRAIAFITALIWLKFYFVDFRIADVLNWPTFGSLNQHVARHALRALAVAVPSLCAILCVMIPVSLLPAKYRGRALLLFDFLFSVLVLTDTLFIRYYSDIFIFHDIMLVPQTGLIVKSIWSLLKPWDALIFIDIPIIVHISRKKGNMPSFIALTRKRAVISAALIFICVFVQAATVWRLRENRPHIINAMYDRLSVCAWISAATFHWGDFFTLTARALRSDEVSAEKLAEIRGWMDGRSAVTHEPYARGKNLILVQCEALQYFVLGLEAGGVEVTPNLNRFRRECLYFSNAWNQTAGGLSSDSEFMANTGMYPASSGAAYTRFADNSYNSLARALKSKGYAAVVFQGTYSAFWNCHRMHPKLGFDRQYSRNTFPNDEVIGLGLSDERIFTEALNVFKMYKRPFYGFIVTLSGHHPFDFEGLDDGSLPLPDDMKGTLIGNYLTAMHYFDREFGRFIDGLRESGLLDKSLIVVYGDHPAIPIAYREELEKLSGMRLEEPVAWKETRRVPLMFRIPGKAEMAGVDERDAGQMDVLPTVAGLMGLRVKTAFGKDLLAEDKGEPVIFRNGAYMAGGVYVEPAANRATRTGTYEKLDYSAYEQTTSEVEKILGYNDLILEKNLINDILDR